MKKITLYIIDDEQEIVTNLTQVFRPNKRFKVRGYTSAEQVRADLDQHPPQLVICDYLMPDCDGIQLLEELKGRFPALRGVLLTGQGFGPEIINGLEQGVVNQYFSKPYDASLLQEAMSKLAREVAKEAAGR